MLSIYYQCLWFGKKSKIQDKAQLHIGIYFTRNTIFACVFLDIGVSL